MAREYINKPPTQTTFSNVQGVFSQPWDEWFRNIERILGYSNNQRVSFEPNIVGATESGVNTLDGSYYRFNTIVFFDIEIDVGGTYDSIAGTTYISNLPYIGERNGALIVNNIDTKISIGNGFIEQNRGSTVNGEVRGYFPTFASSGDNISISGSYQIKI